MRDRLLELRSVESGFRMFASKNVELPKKVLFPVVAKCLRFHL